MANLLAEAMASWLDYFQARAIGQGKPSSWPGFGLAYFAWLGLASGFQAKPAHH